MKTPNKFLLFSLIFLLSFTNGETQEAVPYDYSLATAKASFNQGQFREAIQILTNFLQQTNIINEEQFDTLLLRANAYQTTGAFQNAYADLKQAKEIAEGLGTTQSIMVLTQLGDLSLAVGRSDDALDYVLSAAALAEKTDDSRLNAIAQNNVGNALLTVDIPKTEEPNEAEPDAFQLPPDHETLNIVMRGHGTVPDRAVMVEADDVQLALIASPELRGRKQEQLKQAIEHYDQCRAFSLEGNDIPLAIRATLNKARAAAASSDFDLIQTSLVDSEQLLDKLPDSFEKGFLNLSLGTLSRQVAKANPGYSKFDLKLFSWNTLHAADQLGQRLENPYLQSYAKGYLGELYEQDQRIPEAIQLTRSALFLAQQQANPEMLYRWQWQLGRLLGLSGDRKGAITQYNHAIQTMAKVRSTLTVGYRQVTNIFQSRVKPVYYELAELYLEEANQAPQETDGQDNLRQARDVLESMKTAELQDYFQDECIITFESQKTELDSLIRGTKTAVIYPIIRQNQLELLTSFPEGLKRIPVNVDSSTLKKTVRGFRRELGKRSVHQYQSQAKKLYDWLVRPLEPELQGANIDTLVFVPDGTLRTIPMSALHDGEQFLIEKYAVVTTPGFTLADPQPLQRENSTALLLGLSEPVSGLKGLPAVEEEVQQIADIIGGKILINSTFTRDRLSKELKRESYRIVHMATHGLFNRDPSKTALVTHNGKITLNELERLLKFSKFREAPLELLTLSACETAAGDERAALGLAGVAAKAGARSVIASLWQVSDNATKELMTEFYRQYFEDTDITKALALQNAQKNLIAMDNFNHPFYWAPFLIIGNWL